MSNLSDLAAIISATTSAEGIIKAQNIYRTVSSGNGSKSLSSFTAVRTLTGIPAGTYLALVAISTYNTAYLSSYLGYPDGNSTGTRYVSMTHGNLSTFWIVTSPVAGSFTFNVTGGGGSYDDNPNYLAEMALIKFPNTSIIVS